MQEEPSTLDVLLSQEREYLAGDYLLDTTTTATSSVDPDCRVKMAEWCDQCIDFCKFDRETVEITLNYLDRFATRDSFIRSDPGVFQLAAMTALYTAIKIHQNESVSSKSISSLSRGRYSTSDIEAMELRMISALSWKMNPVTTSAMVRAILDQFNLPKDKVATLYTLAKFQTDAAVRDYNFVTTPPSTIAYCAIRNAIETLHDDEQSRLAECISSFGSDKLHLNNRDTVAAIQKYLCTTIASTTTASSTSLRTNKRRPATPAPEAGNNKQRRIQQTEESPRSSVILQCEASAV